MDFYFNIQISYYSFLPFYQGKVDKVEVFDDQGRCIWISGKHLRQFLTKDGISGRFCLHLDRLGKFISIEKILE